MRGSGFVYQRGRTWSISYGVHGKRIRESTGLTKRSDAVELLRKRVAEKRPAMAHTLTIAGLSGQVENDYTINGRKSLKRVRFSLEHLRQYFGNEFRVAKLDRAAIDTYVLHRKNQGVKNATINRELAALLRGMRLAGLPSIPGIKLKEGPARSGFVDRAQLDAIVVELPEHIQPLAIAGYITGWRIRELTSRRWSDVDFENGWLTLDAEQSKTGQPRSFPLTPELRALLQAQDDGKSEYVFHTKTGAAIGNYYGAWKRACRKAGHEGIIFHDLRRSAARNLIKSGEAQVTAMKLMGHRTVSMFQRYSIIDDEMLKSAGERLAKFHAEESRTRPMTSGEVERLAKTAEAR